MRVIITLLALCLAAVSAVPSISQRIVGGKVTTIDKYPTMAVILYKLESDFVQACGGTILNDKSILTAAHCTFDRDPKRLQIRVGSSYATSGGVVHDISTVIVHPDYNAKTLDSDIAILQTTTTIEFSDVVKPVSLAGADDNIADDEKVWVAGWGVTANGGTTPSEQLRDVEVMIVGQDKCKQRFRRLTDNMLCAGAIGVGGRDSCQNDSGGPLYHNNVQVGISSYGKRCGDKNFPGVYTRISPFVDWIQSNQ